ncbi:MAG: hypothetical protein CMH83_16640 [Nocardioides sp.]|nr:hypothetical protein [Nocardioides sp.]
MWRPADEADYEGFAEHLGLSEGFPTFLPWPLGPDWSVTCFGLVGSGPEDVSATVTCLSGTSSMDGPVELAVVLEDPGTGLGSRVAGTPYDDPFDDVRTSASAVRVRLDAAVGSAVALWPVSTADSDTEWDRSVLAGETEGRWLWLVLRPASAMLLLRDDWILRDAARTGPHLVALPFGGPVPGW